MKDTTGPLKNNRFFFLFLKKRCTRELRKGGGGGNEKGIKGRDLACNSKGFVSASTADSTC